MLLRQLQQPLGDDVSQNLGRAARDRVCATAQRALLKLRFALPAPFGSFHFIGTVKRRFRADRIHAKFIGDLIEFAANKLRYRALGTRRAFSALRREAVDRKSTRLNSSHNPASRMPSSA
jgi:hypothetical protein